LLFPLILICSLIVITCTPVNQEPLIPTPTPTPELGVLGANEGLQNKRLTETYCTYQFSSEPVDRAIDVPKSTGITINSNIGMSVGAGDFSVTGAVSGDISGTVILPIGETTQSVTFNPDAPLSRGEKITVAFHIPLDPCGTPIEEPYVFQFVVDTENYVPSFSDSGQRIGTGCTGNLNYNMNNGFRFDLFDYDPTEPTGVYVSAHDVYTVQFTPDAPLGTPNPPLDCQKKSNLLENNGVGYFQRSQTRFLNSGIDKVSAVGDINSDGLHDLVIKYEPCSEHFQWDLNGIPSHGDTFWGNGEDYGCSLTGWISNKSGDQVTYQQKGYGWFLYREAGRTNTPYTTPQDTCSTFAPVCEPEHLTLVDQDGDQNLELMVGYRLPRFNFGTLGPNAQNYLTVTTSELTELDQFEQGPFNPTSPYYGWVPLDDAIIVQEKARAVVIPEMEPLNSYIDLGVGDLDNDGDDDVVMLTNIVDRERGTHVIGGNVAHPWVYTETNFVSVFLDSHPVSDDGNIATETYKLPATTILSSSVSPSGQHLTWSPKFIDLGDIDGDNDLDLLISAKNEFLLLINRGNGQFLDYELVLEQSDVRFIQTIGSGWGVDTNRGLDKASLVDLDSDGDLDIHRNGCAWLNDGFGEYPETPVTIIERINNAPCPDRSFGALEHIFADFDEDGDIDVMVARSVDVPYQYQRYGIIEVWFNNLYEPDPLLPSFGVIADKYDKSGEKNGGSGFDRETSVKPVLDPKRDESENELQPGTITESEINPHDDENNNQLKSRTMDEPITSVDLTWEIKRIESEGDAGKMITMDYQNSGFLHMMYQEGQSKEVYYKKYNTVSGSHSAAEDIYNRDEGDEVPGDIKAECGLFDLDNGRPVCGSFYLGADLFRFGYIGEQTPVGNFAPAPPWSVEHIEEATGNSGEFSTVLIDSVGSAHIIYYNTSDNNLMYTTLSDNAQSNDWTNWEVPVVIDSEAQVNVGQWAKAVINDNDDIHVIYRSGTNAITHLFSPSSDNSTRTWSKATLVDSLYTKSDLSLALDSDGNPHAVYYQHGSRDLIYASAEVHCCYKPSRWIWSVEPIDVSGRVGRGASLAIGPDDTLHVSYHDETHDSLKYASRTFSSQFNAWSSWDTSTIDKPSNGNIVGKYTDIIVTDSEAVYIAYYDESTGDLKLASGE